MYTNCVHSQEKGQISNKSHLLSHRSKCSNKKTTNNPTKMSFRTPLAGSLQTMLESMHLINNYYVPM